MVQIREKLQERIQELENLIEKKKKELENAPREVLNVSQHGNRVQFYRKNKANGKRKYIRKNDYKAISRLCQMDYNEKLISVANKEIQVLKNMQENYPKIICENVHEQLSVVRKSFVIPIVLSDEEFVAQWLGQEYTHKGFAPDAPEYYTDNGERVRSKSEILIANTLKKYGIPYKYEAPLYLNGYGTIHPDFTVLNVRERKIYYFEHMGMMDDANYAEDALQRINMYEKNGIYPGRELILSHETSKHPMSLKIIEGLILKYLM